LARGKTNVFKSTIASFLFDNNFYKHLSPKCPSAIAQFGWPIENLLNLTDSRFVGRRQKVGVGLIRCLAQRQILPQVWRQECIGLGDGSICRLGKVTQCCGRATRRGVTIVNAGHLQQLLGHRGRYDAGTAGSWDQLHDDRAAFAGNLEVKIKRMCYFKYLRRQFENLPEVSHQTSWAIFRAEMNRTFR
jgi:hypothetical protein